MKLLIMQFHIPVHYLSYVFLTTLCSIDKTCSTETAVFVDRLYAHKFHAEISKGFMSEEILYCCSFFDQTRGLDW
jgi:hypothetical protein